MTLIPRCRRLVFLITAVIAAALPASSIAEPGITPSTVLVGQSAALTGPAQELGLEMKLGIQFAFESVNANGGIFGRRLELRSMDDGYEPDRAAANTKQLIEAENVFALLGYVGTPTSQAALPVFTKAQTPFIGAFTGAQLLREPLNRFIFNVRASYFDETERMVDFAVGLGMKKIAVFYQNDSYGKAGLAGVERAVKKLGLLIVATGTVERNTVDVAGAIKAIAPSNPDVVVMISAYKPCAAFIRGMRAAGSFSQFYNVSFVGSRALAAELGTDGRGVVVSQVVPSPWNLGVPAVREYNKLLQAAKKEPSFGSLEGFLVGKVFAEGLRLAGRDPTREKLIAALETLTQADFGGFLVTFSKKSHNNASNFVDLTMISQYGTFIY